ncbi:hypothetical protein GH733_010434 [Mirounga leonina]|nr:hypothetical protein GH733_010434 [Mirounga leonina]
MLYEGRTTHVTLFHVTDECAKPIIQEGLVFSSVSRHQRPGHPERLAPASGNPSTYCCVNGISPGNAGGSSAGLGDERRPCSLHILTVGSGNEELFGHFLRVSNPTREHEGNRQAWRSIEASQYPVQLELGAASQTTALSEATDWEMREEYKG